MEKIETYCHTELVYNPLTTAVVAVPYRVQENDNIGEIVQMHKTDPNQTGGHFLDYNLEMFLADNPEVVASTKRSIRKDKCDPTKIDTVFYQAWNLKENDLVYLRIPARIDTVQTPGPNVVWFTPEKVSRIRQVTERIEIQKAGLKPKPATEVFKNLCPSDITTDDKPVYVDGESKGDNIVIWSPINWFRIFWVESCLFAFLILLLFIYIQHRITRKAIKDQPSRDNKEIIDVVEKEGKETRGHVSKEHTTTRDRMVNVASVIQKNTEAIENQTTILVEIMKQGGLSGRRSSKRESSSSSSSSSKN